MQLGAWFPQGEIGADPAQARMLLEGFRDLGFRHFTALDHVLGAERAGHPEIDYLPYDETTLLQEPLVLFGFAAALVPELEAVTTVLVLPQRQTALVAKQLAAVDNLNGGHTRLGVGLGWNTVEYEALGMSFGDRARRLEEQAELLRALWTQEIVDFDGRWHRVERAGLNPMPVQRPIPIWFGGTVERARRRAARLGDGYVMPWPLPAVPSESEWPEWLAQIASWRSQDGPAAPFGVEARFAADLEGSSPEGWRRGAEEWRQLGATHLAVKTTGLGLQGADAHLERFALAREALADL